jgi:hypothetical protein
LINNAARKTRALAREIGLLPRTTPGYVNECPHRVRHWEWAGILSERLKLTVSVEYKFADTATKQKIDEVTSALRELGLDNQLEDL